MLRKLVPLTLLAAAVAASALAQSADMEFVREAVGAKAAPAAPRLAENLKVAPAFALQAAVVAVPEEIDAVRTWNQAGHRPMKNGFTRRFAEALSVEVGPVASKEGVAHVARGVAASSANGSIWSGSVKVEGAYRVRLHLADAKIPDGATLWVYGKNDAPTAFGRELVDAAGNLWTPSVAGDTVYLEVEVPTAKGGASFRLTELMEIVPAEAPGLSPKAEDSPTCLIDVTCVSTSTLSIVNEFSKAVAHLEYVKVVDGQSGSYVCSGGLVNDSDTSTTVPYFLTANHCFDTQAAATTLEAYWDWRFASCDSTSIPNPPFNTRTLGATLLATNATSDFTFLRLPSIPAGRVLLGWDADAAAVPNNTTIYRISHPAPEQYGALPQMFSTTRVDEFTGTCSTRPRSNYIYSTGGTGGVYGGSSGSPVILPSGRIVGQLFGSCGPDPTAGCDPRNATLDGRFSVTFNSVKQYLQNSPAQPAPCVENATTRCLSNGRFAVSVNYNTSSTSGAANVIKYTPDSALVYFFGADNIEMLVKVLNGCGVNNRFWVFGAASTDQGYTITVRDSQTGSSKTYTNPLGTRAAAITDTGAFVCP